MKRLFALSVLCLTWGGTAHAQEVPRWDVSGDAGWLSSNKADIGPDWDDWYDEGTAAGTIGHYWSTHVKGELRLAFTGEARIFEERRVVTPGEPFPIFRLAEHRFRKATLGASVLYQFFENQWFHPHLGGGVEIDRERDRPLVPEFRLPSRDPGRSVVLPEIRREALIDWAARPFVTGGFKWYVSERGFVRSDVRVSFGRGEVAHTSWTAGIGVDL